MNSASNSVVHQNNTHAILLQACDTGELQRFVKKKKQKTKNHEAKYESKRVLKGGTAIALNLYPKYCT